jgi:hypothetical protein
MAKFIQIENDVVVELIVADSIEFCIANHGEGFWLEVDEAGVGWIYLNEINKVVPPKPYASWILNQETLRWDSPKPFPNKDLDTTFWKWEETAQDWVGYPLGG